MIILGIETSCDDTGIAIFDSCKNKVLSNIIKHQFKTHAPFGGIVPTLASKEHVLNVLPILNLVLKQAHLRLCNIDVIAYTSKPGLSSSLIIGAVFAKTLSLIYNIPAISIHHLEGHIFSPFLSNKNHSITYPCIALIISGGHTELIHIKNFGEYYILGKTLDDAVGEAFDKVAKMLNLPMPGGKNLENLAQKTTNTNLIFPIPMIKHKSLNFSFSGLKTAVLRLILKKNNKFSNAEIAFAFQESAIQSLIVKLKKATLNNKINNVIIAGGVSSNKRLRLLINKMAQKNKYKIIFPEKQYCTDNGAMIALAGFYRFKNKDQDKNFDIVIQPQAPLDKLN